MEVEQFNWEFFFEKEFRRVNFCRKLHFRGKISHKKAFFAINILRSFYFSIFIIFALNYKKWLKILKKRGMESSVFFLF